MDFTIDPNETAGAFLARGGVIRGVTDGNPDPWNLPPDTLVGDLVTDGSRTLPVLHATTGVVERVLRLEARDAGNPTRVVREERDNVLPGPDNAPSWDVVGESTRWVFYTDAAGYDLAGVRILTLEPDQVRLTVCHWLPSGAATAVEILQTLARNFPALRPVVEEALTTTPEPPAAGSTSSTTPPEPPSGESAATRGSPPGEPAEVELTREEENIITIMTAEPTLSARQLAGRPGVNMSEKAVRTHLTKLYKLGLLLPKQPNHWKRKQKIARDRNAGQRDMDSGIKDPA